MGPAILGGVVLLFILLAYVGAKAWQVWHVVLVVFVFLFACGALILTAATMKTQNRWRTEYQSHLTSLEREQQTQDRLRNGSLDPLEPSVQELLGDVSRILIDRGRVWRNFRLAGIDQGTLTLDASNWGDRGLERIGLEALEDEDLAPPDEPPAAAAGAAAAAPAPLGMGTGAIVFAFKEQPIQSLPASLRPYLYEQSLLPEQDVKGLCKLPSFYMGEYKVTSDPAADPRTITMVPTLPLSPSQVEQLQQDDTTWVLYEVMPTDSHEALQGMAAEQLRLLLEKPEDLPQQTYDQLVDEYVRDQTRATDMDPPERKWMRVKFLDDYTVDVDVQTPTRLPDSAYDPSGRTIEGTLQQNAATQFQKGDEAILDFETAQELVNDGKAEQVEPVYQRRLRDYAEFFRDFAREYEAMDRQLATAQEDLNKLNASLTSLREQMTFCSQQKSELTEDRDGFNRERQVITEYRGQLDEQWNALRRDLSRLYRANKQIVQEQTTSSVGRGVRRDGAPQTRPISAVH